MVRQVVSMEHVQHRRKVELGVISIQVEMEAAATEDLTRMKGR